MRQLLQKKQTTVIKTLLQSATEVYYKEVFYKVRQTVNTKCVRYYKVWQAFIKKCVRYYEVWQLLQSEM